MTFLNPAILIGLLAASIPVIIHLLNLKKLKTIEFSTLMFLKELQKNKIRKIKIKQWLLLFLRVLIIIFIVLSFARPTLTGFNIAGVTSAAKTTSLFLIDNTFSMTVIDQQGSLFNQAKNLAEKIISLHQDGDEVFVSFIANDSISQANINSANFINSLNANDISLLKPELNKSMKEAGEVVNRSKNFNREIFLFSDFQKNLFPSEIKQTDMSELFNHRVRVYFIPFKKDELFNLSIDDVTAENQIIQKGSYVNFLVTITNHSQQNLQNRVLSLIINDRRVAQKSFNINANETQKINIETTILSDGQLNIISEIESDDIEFDNYYFKVINIPEKISALLLRNEVSKPDYLKLALKSLPADKIFFDEKDPSRSSFIKLNDYDIVIISSDNFSNLNQLKSYIEQGGSLMIIPPGRMNINSFNDIVSSLGIGKFESFITNNNKVKLQFDKVDFEHPLFRDLFTKNQQKKIDSPVFTQFLKNNAMTGMPIITLSDNSNFLLENKIGKGKLLLFNSAFNEEWSDFPLKTIFAPLIVKSFFYLSQKDFTSYQLKTEEEFIFNINKINSPRIIVKRPDGTEDYIQMREINSQILKYDKTNIVGIYSFFNGEQKILSFAVNHHPSESVRDFLTHNDFEKYLEGLNFQGKLIEFKPNENPIEKINQSRFGTELWKLFSLLAITTAIAEMIISRNNKKEIQSLTEIS